MAAENAEVKKRFGLQKQDKRRLARAGFHRIVTR